jgi:hypothetical protein
MMPVKVVMRANIKYGMGILSLRAINSLATIVPEKKGCLSGSLVALAGDLAPDPRSTKLLLAVASRTAYRRAWGRNLLATEGVSLDG